MSACRPPNPIYEGNMTKASMRSFLAMSLLVLPAAAWDCKPKATEGGMEGAPAAEAAPLTPAATAQDVAE